ncbi:MAG: hypothetical protein WA113_04670 [Desulfitobacteriaceae bacterium]
MFFKKYLTNKFKDDLTTTVTPSNNNIKTIESLDVRMDSDNEITQETNLNSNSSEDSLQDQYLFGSSSLFNKFKNQNSGPDVLYENEAWVPENEYVGLFRKRRAQVEEQTSPTSKPE